MDKKAMRKMILAKIKNISEQDIKISNCKILNNILQLDVYTTAHTIFVYISVAYEVDTYRLISHALENGKRIVIPRCERGGIMDAVQLTSVNDLVPDRFGIPSAPSDSAIISPDEIDLIVVPAVAFDKYGNRLGRGGGYYDRYLARLPKYVSTVGVCREIQMVDDIDMDKHDHDVDIVVTELKVYSK